MVCVEETQLALIPQSSVTFDSLCYTMSNAWEHPLNKCSHSGYIWKAMLSAIKTWTVARKVGDEVRSKHVVATLLIPASVVFHAILISLQNQWRG